MMTISSVGEDLAKSIKETFKMEMDLKPLLQSDWIQGYCDENDEKVLIYEYLSKGSLDRYLNDTSLTWMKRLNICIDVARALDFLHRGVGKQAKVIHRDIKTENILLNNDWKAKLADFGLSLICSINQETDYIMDHACGFVREINI
ncbi:probable serine/threonine-protein kinase PBL17 [Helianthus annuus]|uniref:probable serine/threonine-protein kinase PBL17 n=1 Tax=Helianthus annuus TaxID=4232 RepID=UPI001652F34E|nr:probable serine/threonine-protein kinase PBL17 [Helianthus annuus]